ncbi:MULTISPECIES: hypothetical protein [Actinokineospora]|uniref:Uncharacterized protein n=1 Tax=Actinokineospora fastidiosa TaxID=1816 RepID=A0A918L8A4_9PSEU|nr:MULTISPECIES: hypothetical protein [Actinokineospora]UVS76479.1 hypothetical protein Actkin_00166 [Actinokineospora sp. UTMC 2448]GGS17839.1 hypothetical protein GCM10010171_07940 [Actinokineospora fastidiosa]
MSNHALILHLTGRPEPLVFALSDKSAKSLMTRLPVLMGSAGVDSPELADGSTVAINFGLVATAHIEELPLNQQAYGSPKRGTGFGG